MAKRQAQQLQGNTPVISPTTFVPKTDVAIPPDLPIVVKGQRLSEEEIIRVAKFACDIYATNTYPLHDCLKFAGVLSEATFHFWKRDFKAVKDLFEKAKADKSHSYRNQVRELAWDSMKKQIAGYTVDLDEISDTIEFVEDEGGGSIQKVTSRTIKKRQVYIKPSPTVTMFALVNLDNGNFSKTPNVGESQSIPDGLKIEIVGRAKPVVDESEISDIDFE